MVTTDQPFTQSSLTLTQSSPTWVILTSFSHLLPVCCGTPPIFDTLNCPSLQFGEILNRCCANVWSQFENDIFLSPRGCELDFCLTCRQMVIKTNKENITKQKNPILIPHSISQIIVCLVEMSPEKAMLFKSFLTSFFLNHKYESWTKHIDWVLLEAVWGQGMGFYLKQAWD